MRIDNNFVQLNNQIKRPKVGKNVMSKPAEKAGVSSSVPSFRGNVINKFNTQMLGWGGAVSAVMLHVGEAFSNSCSTAEFVARAVSGIAFFVSFTMKELPKKLIPHIDFKNATSIAEAKDFAGDILRIPKFKMDDLEFANWANEGITLINNRFRGQIFVPRRLELVKTNENYVGAYYPGFDSLAINKQAFEIPDEQLKKIVTEIPVEDYNLCKLGRGHDEFVENYNKLKADISSLSCFEKKAFMSSFANYFEAMFRMEDIFSKILNEDIEKIAQKGAFGDVNTYGPVYNNKFHTIWHEMGHVFDYKSSRTLVRLLSPKLKNADKLVLPQYTRSKRGELVADLFAGYMNGDLYLPSVDDLFKRSTKIRFPD